MPVSLFKNRTFIAISALAILAAFSLSTILDVFFRQFWFDEVITIMDFLLLPDPSDIYRMYNIPNNHIAYTMLLRLWINICGAVPFLDMISVRLLSVAIAIAAIIMVLRYWSKRLGMETAITACFCLALSLPFAIYATAIRGYMLSFLLVLAALELAIRYRDTGSKRLLPALFVISFLAVGTTPTNLIAFAAIYIYLLPSFNLKDVLNGRMTVLAVLPVTGFLLFYIPIWGKLINALSLREGWSSGIEASVHLYSAFFISFLPLAALASASVFILKQKPPKSKLIPAILVFLLPMIIFLFKSPAPFPRAFFCLWPLWIFILCAAAVPCIRRLNEKLPSAAMYLLILACILWASAVSSISIPLSDMLAKGGQDDFFRPYFMRNEFRPAVTVKKCIDLSTERKNIRVFIDFAADYPSIVFYGRRMEPNQGIWVFDKPGSKVESFGTDEKVIVIARNSAEMDAISRRFKMKSFELLADCGYQKIYEAFLK